MIIKPFKGSYILTSNFEHHRASGGSRAQYAGTDWGMPIGTPIYAMFDGVVTKHWGSSGGNYIQMIGSGYKTHLLHLSSIVKTGAVKQGELIAYSGNTGNSTGPHLHVTFWVNGVLTNIENKFTEQNHMEKDTIVIQPGWGVSNVAKELGMDDWYLESAWNKIAKYNGYDSYSQMPTLSAGDVLSTSMADKVEIKKPIVIDEVEQVKQKVVNDVKLEQRVDALEDAVDELKKGQSKTGALTATARGIAKFNIPAGLIGYVLIKSESLGLDLTEEDIAIIFGGAMAFITFVTSYIKQNASA